MQALGQEIGCHGLTHTDEEEYDRMPEEMQERYIEQATQKLEAVAGVRILAFRSPRVKTSAHTLRLLAEHGYRADSSVCSQRIDFVSSNLNQPELAGCTAASLPSTLCQRFQARRRTNLGNTSVGNSDPF